MRKVLSGVLMVFFISVGNAQEIKWMNMNEALEAQKKNPKKIFMDVYTDWCGPCKMLDKNTFHDKDVVEFVNKHFYAVKFNAEGAEEITYQGVVYANPNHDPDKKGRNSQHKFASALSIRGYPTLVFFDEESKVISPIVGYKTPAQLEIYLKMIANDDYKKVTTSEGWKEYQADFKGTFDN